MTRKKLHLRALLCAWTATAASGCVSESLVSVTPPQTIVDPSVVATPAGATQLYNNAVTTWSQGVGASSAIGAPTSLVFVTGMWTDELLHVQGSFGANTAQLRLDERVNNALTASNFSSY